MKKKKRVLGWICPIVLLLFLVLPVWENSRMSGQEEPLIVTVTGKYRDGQVGKVLEDREIYKDTYFTGDSTRAQGGLAKLSMLASAAAYSPKYSEDLIKKCRFKTHKYVKVKATKKKNNVVSYEIGIRENNGIRIVAVWIRGTGRNYEWVSNWNLGRGDVHAGFGEAEEKMWRQIQSYLEKKKVSLEKNGKVRFWITGHSRGAAAANLFAVRMNEQVGKKNVFAYTFATPNVSKKAQAEGYENIFNYINPQDFITAVAPEAWGYHRYGRDRILDAGPASEAVKCYQKLSGRSYNGFTPEEKERLLKKLLDYAGGSTEDYYKEHMGYSPAFFFQEGVGYYLAGNQSEGIANCSLVWFTDEKAGPIVEELVNGEMMSKLGDAHAPLIYICSLRQMI